MALTSRQEQLLRRTFLDYRATEDFLENPLIVDRADGLYLWDSSGKRYFDAIGGSFVAILGHRHPRVLDAMRTQMERATFIPPLHAISNITLDFVERVGAVTPGNLKYVKPLSGGSESIEAAIKFVRQYHKQTGNPGKHKFVTRYHSYHGGTFGAMAASGCGQRKSKFDPQMPGFLPVFPPSHYRDVFVSWDDANRFAAESVEAVILHEDPDTVAGMIVEPIGNTGGIITPTAEYFQILRHICDRYNVSLIFDEVITGFAKTGRMFAAQAYDVTPDLICAGKGLSSGAVPLGAMIARESMAQAFTGSPGSGMNFAHGHTFAGNPLACAVGIAVIDEIVFQGLCAKAEKLGEYLASRLACLKKLGVVREIRGMGMIRGVEFTGPNLGTALKRTAIANGIILRIDPGWFAVSPPLIAEESDIDEMCGLIENSVKDALKLTPSKNRI